MKKLTLTLLAFVALTLSSCGNDVISKMEGCYEKAIAAAEKAVSADELNEISTNLVEEMQALSVEAGNDVALQAAFEEMEGLAVKYTEVFKAKEAELTK